MFSKRKNCPEAENLMNACVDILKDDIKNVEDDFKKLIVEHEYSQRTYYLGTLLDAHHSRCNNAIAAIYFPILAFDAFDKKRLSRTTAALNALKLADYHIELGKMYDLCYWVITGKNSKRRNKKHLNELQNTLLLKAIEKIAKEFCHEE